MRDIIEAALPTRRIRISRTALIDALDERIGRFLENEPLIKPWREKAKSLMPAVNRLRKAVDKEHTLLLQKGLAKEIENAVEAKRWLDPGATKIPIGGASAMTDLHFTLENLLKEIARWERVWRPPAHRLQAPRVGLVKDLQELCRDRAGLSVYEFEDFLQALNACAAETALPKLTVAGTRQRDTRRRRATK